MKVKKGLQLSVIFAPLLALVVGIALFFKSQYVDEVGARIRLLDTVAEDVFELDILCQEYLARHEQDIRAEWQARHAALAKRLSAESMHGADEQIVFDTILRNHKRLGDIFAQLVTLYDSQGPGAGAAADRLANTLLRLSQTMVTEALKLATISHGNALTAQQYTDALIIIFVAILAVLLAALAYFTIREELDNRRQMAKELERSHILLSDAFVKLRRAEMGIQQERAPGVGAMVRSMAGEIRAQLMPIMRTSETLLNYPENLRDENKAAYSLKTINQAAAALDGVLNRLVTISQNQHHIAPKSVNLNRLVDDALNFVQPRLATQQQGGAEIKLQKELQQDLPLIDGAEDDLREALVNILLNAIEAMPGGGTLAIATQTDGSTVKCRIADTGRGMSDEVLRHCCDPFFSTKDEAADGMGLTIVSAILRRHQGQIDFKSRVGEGTTVSLELPVHLKLTFAETSVPAAAAGRKLRILLIDDQPWITQALTELMTFDGHTVEVATDGRGGVAKFHAGPFDLVVTDRAMPDMSGEQVAEEIKKAAPRMPIILLTGFGNIIKDAGIRSATVDVIVGKPVTAEKMRQAIGEAMAKQGQR
jgi:signal transduction histidine kinase/CheY-like chemotaxis protein